MDLRKRWQAAGSIGYRCGSKEEMAGCRILLDTGVDLSTYSLCFTGQEASKMNWWCPSCQTLDHKSSTNQAHGQSRDV